MKWIKFTIKTRTEAEDFISSMLADLGIEGVEIEDNLPLSQADRDKLYIDILPVLPLDEGIAYVSFFLTEDQAGEAIQKTVAEELNKLRDFVDIGEGSISISETEDKDWINNWKQYFKAFVVEDIFIKPTWEEMPKDVNCRCVIEIDPGTSFGTGKHETTQLCIRQLRKYLKAEDVILDVGCGSGILSIVGLKLGAASVVGTDIDPICMTAVKENLRVNRLPEEQGSFYLGNLIEDEALQRKTGVECYDIVVANILADVIILLTPVIPERLKSGGIYITSGIIDFKEKAVIKAMVQADLEILEVCHQGEWVSVTARKK